MHVVTTERDAVTLYASLFARDFDIAYEVSGRHCTGRTLRIDMLLRPRRPWGQTGSRQPIGVEIKHPDKAGKYSAGARMLGQAIDYTHTRFPTDTDCPYVHVFTPLRIISRSHPEIAANSFFTRFLGQVGVGFIQPCPWDGMRLNIGGASVWNLRRGITNQSYSGIRKVGSR